MVSKDEINLLYEIYGYNSKATKATAIFIKVDVTPRLDRGQRSICLKVSPALVHMAIHMS